MPTQDEIPPPSRDGTAELTAPVENRTDGSWGNTRFQALDAWRGIAALVVAASHFNTTGFIGGGAFDLAAGRMVDFFFVLSGFVIAHAYREELPSRGPVPFLLKRVGRLWPLHLVTLGGIVVMAIAGSRLGLSVRSWDWQSLPEALTLTHAWGWTGQVVWNLPSWSISTEMFAYLLFGLLAWRLRGKALDFACAAILVGAVLVLVTVARAGFLSTHDFGLARCLAGFMAGVLTQRLWRAGLRAKGEVVAVVLAIACAFLLPRHIGGLVLPVLVWVILVFAADAGPVSRLLKRRVPQMLGTVSYSIYMVHYPIGVVLMTAMLLLTNLTAEVAGLATVVGPWWLADAISIAYLAVVVGVSLLTYAWIETPGRLFFRRRADRGAGRRSDAAAPDEPAAF